MATLEVSSEETNDIKKIVEKSLKKSGLLIKQLKMKQKNKKTVVLASY